MPAVKVGQVTPYVIMRTKSISVTSTAYKLAKGEGDEVLLIHAIIGVLATLIPLINLAFLILIFRAISDMSKDEMDELSKHSIVFKFLFKKI